MCGRVRQTTELRQIKIRFQMPPTAPVPNLPPHWNGAPMQQLAFVRHDADAGGRVLEVGQWSLLPAWSKERRMKASTFNARAETLVEKPMWKQPFQRRRCLVPVDGYYEWREEEGGKQPYHIGAADGGMLALAGLWDLWRAPDGSETVRSFTIVVTAAQGWMTAIHDRVPAIVPEAAWGVWLGEEPATQEQLLAIARDPVPPDQLVAHPVDRRVGNVRNDEPALAEPIGPPLPRDAGA